MADEQAPSDAEPLRGVFLRLPSSLCGLPIPSALTLHARPHPLRQGCIGRGSAPPPPPLPGRPAYAQPLSLTPSASFNGIHNRQ